MTQHYHRNCRTCGVGIRMVKCLDGYWRAFDYPDEGSGDWEVHNKGGSC